MGQLDSNVQSPTEDGLLRHAVVDEAAARAQA
jgi:hypothetical protein